MSGSDKLKRFLISKSGKPRCIRGVKVENLVKYACQNSSWMTQALFEGWPWAPRPKYSRESGRGYYTRLE